MIPRSKILCAIFFVLPGVLLSQSKVTMKLITHEDGLSDNQVTCLAQDQTGYLWVGTTGGLNRFDGHDFKVFRSKLNDSNSLTNDYITGLSVDNKNRLWIGHLIEGVTLYDPGSGSFKRFPEIKGTANSFFFQGEDVWIGQVQYGFCKFNPNSRQVVQFSLVEHMNKSYSEQDKKTLNTVNSFLRDSSGLLWLGTTDGLYSFNVTTNELKPHRLAKDGPGAERDDLISSMYYDAKTNVIYIPSLHGIKEYHIATGKVDVYTYANDNPNFYLTRITGLQQKSNHELWLNSADKGLAVFNTSTKKFDFSVGNNQVVYPGPLLNTKDRLWIGCGLGLVNVGNEKKIFEIRSITYPGHHDSYITDIYADSVLRKKFIATEHSDGLIVTDWDEKSKRNYFCKTNRAQSGYVISTLFNLDDRYLLVPSRDYIQLFDKVNETWVDLDQSGTTDNIRAYFSSVVRDNNGNIWISSMNDGVRLFDPKSRKIEWFTFVPGRKSRIGSNNIRGIIKDPWNRIWISTTNNGVQIFDPTKKEFTNVNDLDLGVKIPVFKDGSSMAMGRDSTIWIGSISGGLFKIKLHNKRVISFTANSASISVAMILTDEQGLVWVMPPSGAWIPQYGEIVMVYDPVRNLSRHYVPESRQFPFYSMTRVGNTVAMTGKNCYYLPKNISSEFSDSKKTLVINSLKINGQEVGIDPRGGSIELPYDQNSLLIQFSSVDFCDPTNNQYSFKLEGLETKWNNVSSNQRVATYSKLPPGSYVFKMKLMNPDDSGKETELIFITVFPPFWKTWWFVTATVIALILTIYFIVIYFTNRGVKEESLKKELNRAQLVALRTQMNPHFIFNSLNSIQGLIIRSDIPKATQFTARFSKLIRKVLENSEKQLISIQEEIESLELYLSIESIRFEGKFKYSLDIDEEILSAEIPSMVVQPIVENAIWQNLSHSSQQKQFDICFKKDAEKIYCTISHNVDVHEEKNSLTLPEKAIGLKLTASRLGLISSGSVIEEADVTDQGGQLVTHIIKIVFDMKSMARTRQLSAPHLVTTSIAI